MDMQEVDCIQFIEHRGVVTYKDAFEFRKDRPAHWLQRLCLWTLRKLGAYHQQDTLKVTRHRIDSKTFMERIFKQQRTVAELLNQDPTQLLIGAEDYEEMMDAPEIHQSFSFEATYYKNRTIRGLEVKVIPWMRGLLVMP